MTLRPLALALPFLAAMGCSSTPEPQPPPPPPVPTAAEATPPPAATVASDAPAGSSAAKDPGLAPLPPPEGPAPPWMNKPVDAYRAGDAAAYLPKDCKDRIFLNVSGLVGPSAVDVRKALDRSFHGGSERDAADNRKMLRALAAMDQAGVEPVSNLNEVAVCVTSGHEVVAIGFSTRSVIELPVLVQKLQQVTDDDPGTVTRSGDQSIFRSGHDVLIQPTATVAVIGREDEVTASIKAKAGASGFAQAKGQLVYAKGREVDANVTENAGKIAMKLVFHMAGQSKAKDSKALNKKITDEINSGADKLKGTSLEPLGASFKAAKVSVQNGEVTITGSIDRATLNGIAPKFGPADMEQLDRMF